MTTIRRITGFGRADFPGLDAVFRATCSPAFKTEPAATIASWVYCHQYPPMNTEPQPNFVLETGAGEIVGYILGTASTPEFTFRWKRSQPWMNALARQGICPPPDYLALGQAEPAFEDGAAAWLLHMALRRPNQLLGAGIPELWQKWPAHFHINILPEYQRQGWGRALMEAYIGVLDADECRGVHLAMDAGNRGAEKFYLALGFERYPGVLDEGVSGELGRTGGANPVLYLVKTLWQG